MKILLLLPLLLGFSVPAIAHNIFNGGESGGALRVYNNAETEEGEGAETEELNLGGFGVNHRTCGYSPSGDKGC